MRWIRRAANGLIVPAPPGEQRCHGADRGIPLASPFLEGSAVAGEGTEEPAVIERAVQIRPQPGPT